MPKTVRVDASVDVIRWGSFDASFPAVAEIDSGVSVILECLSGAPEVMPPRESMMAVHPVLREVHAKTPRPCSRSSFCSPVGPGSGNGRVNLARASEA